MNWHQITPSPLPWERAALDHVKALLPERHPYQAWSNFTFTSDRGHIREVDLLVAAPSGLHLVEIKSFRGRLSNRGSTWVLDEARRRAPFDSALPLADQKAKELKGLLGDAARAEKFRPPFVRGSIFLSDRRMRCDLEPGQRHHLYGPAGNAADLPDVAELLLAPPQRQIDPQFFRRLDALLRKIGSYPAASRDDDGRLLLGWAGWDHREQAQALAVLVTVRRRRPTTTREPKERAPRIPRAVDPAHADSAVTAATSGPLSNEEIRTLTGLDAAGARTVAASLVKEGRLTTIGQKRGTRYLLPDPTS